MSAPVWCVQHRDGWCACARNRKPRDTSDAVRTRCKHVVMFPHGSALRQPTCPDCYGAPNPKREGHIYCAANRIIDEVIEPIRSIPPAQDGEGLRGALDSGIEALNTWVHVHAPDECREEDVKASRERLMEGGTLWYLATVLEKLRRARATLNKGE